MLLPKSGFGLSTANSLKAYVWSNARHSSFLPCESFRIDSYGKLIAWSEYGKTMSRLGWEIDHIIPLSKGGTDTLNNLQALQWRVNRIKSNH